jgi:protein-L-isoaspartate(D-aspartate) O-methyltransferase
MKKLLDYWWGEKIITNKEILDAFRKVDRKKFIPSYLKEFAYHDIPLHISDGQTISQPTTVAIMTQALNPEKKDKVLEIGSGSGYQSAILSHLSDKVFSIEYLKSLYLYAKKNLKSYKNVEVLHGDGSKGYKKKSPYDKIIVTAAAPKIPKALIKQLKIGGVVVNPVGEIRQDRVKVTKTRDKIKK